MGIGTRGIIYVPSAVVPVRISFGEGESTLLLLKEWEDEGLNRAAALSIMGGVYFMLVLVSI